MALMNWIKHQTDKTSSTLQQTNQRECSRWKGYWVLGMVMGCWVSEWRGYVKPTTMQVGVLYMCVCVYVYMCGGRV